MSEVQAPAGGTKDSNATATTLTNLGTVNDFAKAGNFAIAEGIRANKLSGNPVLRFRKPDGTILGIVFSKRAGERHPIDSALTKQDCENLYVQEGQGEDGNMRYIITTGGSLTFRIPD